MAPLKKIFRECACFIEIFLAGSLFYLMLRRNLGSLPQERVVFKQILKTGNVLFNMFKSQLFVQASNEVWGKVIFSQASVCPWDCGRHPQADTCGQIHPPRDTTPDPEATTEPGGTHPTGMHSCHVKLYILKSPAGRTLNDWYVKGYL